ncbi:MAG TPA: MerR family transcriptional regulator [Candidatus Angelobacter sp.]|nr:MerR family transcriptional regulator [Candidatus Angelobacter sp.]
MFPIGRFARLAGISAKQLRAYDEIGLFRPVWVDPSSAYRYYSPAQLPELRRILALRQLGMPIDEIGRIVHGGDLRAALARRRDELERERRLAEERLAALDISVADESGPDVVVRPVGVELVAVAPVTPPVDEAFDRLEAVVRDLGRRAHRPPGAIPEQREIFVPVTGPIPEADGVTYRRLPAVRVASVIHRGPYAGITAARASLLRWVDAAGLERSGPMRTLYLQFGADPSLRLPPGWTVDRDDLFVTELQQPIG